MTNTIEVHVGSLGTVRGVRRIDDGIESFLGIPYGRISKRWTRAEPISSFPTAGYHDGTTYGPRCPQLATPVSITQVAVSAHPPNPDVIEDEFQCLNLNVVRPAGTGTTTLKTLLPVMVWIHGGALSCGANSETVYNGVDMTRHSVDSGSPIIHVAINYRVGFFGFLASKELLAETGNVSVGNYGLWDQNLALKFVREWIGYFGGDPQRVTIFGESAGGASVQSHLIHGEALFNRAICQSGVTATSGPLPLDSPFQQGLFDALAREARAPSLAELRSISSTDLVGLMPHLFRALPVFFGLDDSHLQSGGGFFPTPAKLDPAPSFCDAYLVGYCGNEGIIIATSLAATEPETLHKVLTQSHINYEVLSAYGLTNVLSLDLDRGHLVGSLVRFATDLVFQAPSEIVKSQLPPDRVYSYRIERPNLWGPSPFSGTPHHTIDLLYLAGVPFRIPSEQPDVDEEIARKMITAWVEFGNGRAPWEAYSDKRKELVISREGTVECVVQELASGMPRDVLVREMCREPEKYRDLNAVLSNGAVRY